MLSDEEVNIIKHINIFIYEKTKLKNTYSFYIDGEYFFKELKTLIEIYAHLLKDTYYIFYKDENYTDFDDNIILEKIFPLLTEINLDIIIISSNINNHLENTKNYAKILYHSFKLSFNSKISKFIKNNLNEKLYANINKINFSLDRPKYTLFNNSIQEKIDKKEFSNHIRKKKENFIDLYNNYSKFIDEDNRIIDIYDNTHDINHNIYLINNINLNINNNIINEIRNDIENNQNIDNINLDALNIKCFSPIFGTNILLGADDEEYIYSFIVNVSRAFADYDIKLSYFPIESAYCNNKQYVYISGGLEKIKEFGHFFYRIYINDNKFILEKLSSMIYSHSNHSMISNHNYIFSIGGKDSVKCEFYKFSSGKWESFQDLISDNYEIQRPMLFLFNNFLYSFMGYDSYEIINKIQRLNIEDIYCSLWEPIIINVHQNVKILFYGAAIIKKNDELMFIGGKYALGKDTTDYKKDIYIFNLEANIFFNHNSYLVEELNFIENTLFVLNDDKIGNFSNDGYFILLDKNILD